MAWFGLALKGASLALTAIGMFSRGGSGTGLILNEVLLQLRDVNASLVDIHETLLDVKRVVEELPDNDNTKSVTIKAVRLSLDLDKFNLTYGPNINDQDDIVNAFRELNAIRVSSDELMEELFSVISELETPKYFLRVFKSVLSLVPIVILLNRLSYIPSIFVSEYFPRNTQVPYGELQELGVTKGELLASMNTVQRTAELVAPESAAWSNFLEWSASETGFDVSVSNRRISATKELRRRNIFPAKYRLEYSAKYRNRVFSKRFLMVQLDIDEIKIDKTYVPSVSSNRILANPPATKEFRKEYDDFAKNEPKANVLHDELSSSEYLDFDSSDRNRILDETLLYGYDFNVAAAPVKAFLSSIAIDKIVEDHDELLSTDPDTLAHKDFERTEENMRIAALFGFLNFSGEFISAQIEQAKNTQERLNG